MEPAVQRDGVVAGEVAVAVELHRVAGGEGDVGGLGPVGVGDPGHGVAGHVAWVRRSLVGDLVALGREAPGVAGAVYGVELQQGVRLDRDLAHGVEAQGGEAGPRVAAVRRVVDEGGLVGEEGHHLRRAVDPPRGGSAHGRRGDVCLRREDLPDAAVARVGDVDVPVPVHRDRSWAGKERAGGRAAVPGETCDEPAGKGADDAGGGDFPHGGARVELAAGGGVDVPLCVDSDAARHQRRARRRTTIAAVTGNTDAGDGADQAGGPVDLTDPVARHVADIDVLLRVHGDGKGLQHAPLQGRDVFPEVLGGAGAGHRADDLGGGVNHPDAVIGGVADVDVVVSVDRDGTGGEAGTQGGTAVVHGGQVDAPSGDEGDDAGGGIDPPDPATGGDQEVVVGIEGDVANGDAGTGGGHVVARIGGTAVAGIGGDDAGRSVYLADPAVVHVRNIDVAGAVGDGVHRVGKARVGCRPSVPDHTAPGEGADVAGRSGDEPDAPVAGVVNVHVVIAVKEDGGGLAEQGGGRGAAVAGKAGDIVAAGNGNLGVVAVVPGDPVAARFGDVEVAIVESEACRAGGIAHAGDGVGCKVHLPDAAV